MAKHTVQSVNRAFRNDHGGCALRASTAQMHNSHMIERGKHAIGLTSLHSPKERKRRIMAEIEIAPSKGMQRILERALRA